jgi:hypothetical protein
MPASFALAAPTVGVYRVARSIEPFTFRKPASAVLALSAPLYGGNRWDDPAAQYATLYCASSDEAAFGETIARYRERPGLLAKIDAYLTDAPDREYDYPLQAGRVPRSYFENRYLGHVAVEPTARYFWELSTQPEHEDWYGLRYTSRLNGEWECWAIWKNPLRQSTIKVRAVTRKDPALISAAGKLGLTI